MHGVANTSLHDVTQLASNPSTHLSEGFSSTAKLTTRLSFLCKSCRITARTRSKQLSVSAIL